MLAFDQALAQGVDALEFDVRITADAVPVVIHDPDVDRTTNGTGPVVGFRLAELQALDAGSGQRIPSLEEVLHRYPDLPMLIEVKEARAAMPLRQVLERNGASRRVLLGSFHRAALRPFDRP